MKDSKIITPALLFLMTILLSIAVYYNFIYKPLETKIEAIAMENELLKTQRLEIELAMIDINGIKKNIEDMKISLKNNQDMDLIDGQRLADDINFNAKTFHINLNNITIGEPLLVEKDADGENALIYIPAKLSFDTTYENGANFIGSFENSQIGAYMINNLELMQGETEQLSWNVSLSLYYYGSHETASVPEEAKAETDGREALEWTQ